MRWACTSGARSPGSCGWGFAINLHLFAASPFRADGRLEYPFDPPWTPPRATGSSRPRSSPGLGIRISQGALRRHGHHFFHGTRLRIALRAVMDRGIKAAKEAGDVAVESLADRVLAPPDRSP